MHCWQVSWRPGDWEVNEQVLEEVGSMEANSCHLNLKKYDKSNKEQM